MRYVKGAIEISEHYDLPILRVVYRAGHLTTRQLFDHLHPSQWQKNRWDTFRWRVRRLANHDFIEIMCVAGIGDVLRLGENGELFLQGKEPSVVERNTRNGGTNGRNQVWHDIELFGIQIALWRADIVVSWQHEIEIRSQNDFTTFRYAKDYDAVVTFRCGGKDATVALEYERTAKSSKEYARICEDINREERVAMFLYLAPSLQLQNFLLHALRMTRRELYVGLVREFCENPTRADLIDARSGCRRCLVHLFGAPHGA
jgi:hypothetical protein